MSRSIPVYTPGSKTVPSASVDPYKNVPNHSAYTTEFLGYGAIPKGTMSDAPVGHPNHGKPFHGGIELVDKDGSKYRMIHRLH